MGRTKRKEFVEKCMVSSASNSRWCPPKNSEELKEVIEYWENIYDAIDNGLTVDNSEDV